MKTFKVITNFSKQTITIKVYEEGKLSEIYKDDFASRDEIENAEYWTAEDVRDYLKTFGNYFRVK